MLKTLIVVDDPADDLAMDTAEIISFDTYLSDYPKLGQSKRRVLNLCDTEHYLSRGYYCSLLAEARQHKVMLEDTLESLEQSFDYPMVIKLPESSFSLGVFKVDTRDQLRQRLQELLTDTALVLVQEFCFTEFDWRIGVLNGKPIYACRYHMARKHWQIYNHGAARSKSGRFDSMPTFEVPTRVLSAAVKACAVVGNGLYGVDLKQRGESVFVIEVNDNPSIDHGVENRYLGDELYMIVMSEFTSRLEARGR